MITDTFHNSSHTTVPHAEAFGSDSVEVDFPGGSTVTGHVSSDDLHGRIKL